MTARHGVHAQADEALVVWHELECGGYRDDLPLWRELADQYGDPVLDIGAGTGRVAVELAAAGHRVTALERDHNLVAELARRTSELSVTIVNADATDFRIDDRFALCIVAMQTIQLLGGPSGRRAFLECAKCHLRAGGALAAAIVEALEPFEVGDGVPELPAEVCERHGVLYSTRPTAVLAKSDGFVLERRRETTRVGARRAVAQHSLQVDRLTSSELEHEAIASGLRPLGRSSVPASWEHVGSTVVLLAG